MTEIKKENKIQPGATGQSTQKPLLRVEHLKEYFKIPGKGYLHAVDDITMEIMPNETLGLVGESGCGKSTVGNVLMRLLKPTGGKIFYEDKDVTKPSKKENLELTKKTQMVFQDPYSSLNPRMRVGKIVQDPLNLMDLGSHEEREEREKEVFEQIGLHQAQRALFPHQFSGGQRQRISIGRALASYPELIICDEPVSALDVAIQAQILNLFMDLQEKNNLTYLFISHDLGVVQHMCDDIGVMYLGRFAEVADSPVLIYCFEHLKEWPRADEERWWIWQQMAEM